MVGGCDGGEGSGGGGERWIGYKEEGEAAGVETVTTS